MVIYLGHNINDLFDNLRGWERIAKKNRNRSEFESKHKFTSIRLLLDYAALTIFL